jgi:hypothetical protein
LVGGEPARDVPAEHASHQVLGLWRDGGERARREPQVPPEHGLEGLPRGGSVEGHGPGEHHVEHDAGAPDVHLLVVLPPRHHLGRDVAGRPDEARHGAAVPEPVGGAEVPEPEHAGGVEEEVVRLDVAVRDPAEVAGRERVGDLRHEARRLGLRERAAGLDEGDEVPAGADVEHEVDGVGVLERGVERDEVRAGGRGRRREEVDLGLLLRQREVQRVGLPQRRLGRGLDREGLPRGDGVAAADGAEAAVPDLDVVEDVLAPQRLLAGAHSSSPVLGGWLGGGMWCGGWGCVVCWCVPPSQRRRRCVRL